MGLLKGVEGWSDSYATPNSAAASPRDWRRPSSELGVRHVAWHMAALAQLVSVAIQAAGPAPLLATAGVGMGLAPRDGRLLGAGFLAALALCQAPAGWLADRIGARLVVACMLLLSAVAMAAAPHGGLAMPCALVLGGAQAALAPTSVLLLASWARSPAERDRALLCNACGSAGGRFGALCLLSYLPLLRSWVDVLRCAAAAAGIAAVLWLALGGSTPSEWGLTPLSWLLPLTVSDLEALPPANINEKAIAAKKEREQRQQAKLAKQQAAGTASKYARKMGKRSGDAYNEYKAKADAKKAAAAAAKAEAATAAKEAAGERNTGADFSRALGGAKVGDVAATEQRQQREQLGGRLSGVVALLLRPGAGLGTLALCQLACGLAAVALPLPSLPPPPPLLPEQDSEEQRSLQTPAPLLLLMTVLPAVLAGPAAAAVSARLRSRCLNGGSTQSAARRLLGCGAMYTQGAVLLAVAFGGTWQGQGQQQKEEEDAGWLQAVQTFAPAALLLLLLQACAVGCNVVGCNEIALQSIELAAQERAPLGLLVGTVNTIGYAPAAAAAAAIAAVGAAETETLAGWQQWRFMAQIAAACACIAGGWAFSTVEVKDVVPVGSHKRRL